MMFYDKNEGKYFYKGNEMIKKGSVFDDYFWQSLFC